jgi:predicted ATPase with chaperone activity
MPRTISRKGGAVSVVEVAAVPVPAAPRDLAESGLNADLVTQLVLKTLHLSGTMNGLELATRLGVRFAVIEASLDNLKWQHHVEVVAGSMIGEAAYTYRITDAGRERAALFLEHNHYVGVAPVPLDQYRRYLRNFQNTIVNDVSPAGVRTAFAKLVLTDHVLDQLGPAVAAGRSLFVYGPPGNGKTVISQCIRNLLHGEIAVPHALVVEGSIIRFYDPVNHEAVEEGAPAGDESALDRAYLPDARWVRCRRPLITVGGELTLDSLELNYSQSTGFYRAPIQAIANGGVLVIDDFGRQHCSARDLLNRWIVPLESRVDFLTLQTGQKFEMPFVVLVVFATNLKPAELVDEAFLRRIQYKVFAESPTHADFVRIFKNYCAQTKIEFEAALVERLLVEYFRPRKIPLRGCQPGALIEQALALAEYSGRGRHLTMELLTAACNSYFVDDRDVPTEYA